MEAAPGEPGRKAIFLRQCDGFRGVRVDYLRLAPITRESPSCHYQRMTEAKQMLGLARASQSLFCGLDGPAYSTEELKSLARVAGD